MKIFYDIARNETNFSTPDITIDGREPNLFFDNSNEYFYYAGILMLEYEYVHIKSPKTGTFKSFKLYEHTKMHSLSYRRYGEIFKKIKENYPVDLFSDMEENSPWVFVLIRERV